VLEVDGRQRRVADEMGALDRLPSVKEKREKVPQACFCKRRTVRISARLVKPGFASNGFTTMWRRLE
jgi:hypothetical protein